MPSPKVETIKNQFIQDHHTLSKYQLLNITTPALLSGWGD